LLESDVNNNHTSIVNITIITEYRIFRIIVPLKMTNSLNFETCGIRSLDVLLTVHLSIILVINQPNAQILVL